MNLTKTVRKLPITSDLQRKGYYTHDDKAPDIKYDTEEQQVRASPPAVCLSVNRIPLLHTCIPQLTAPMVSMIGSTWQWPMLLLGSAGPRVLMRASSTRAASAQEAMHEETVDWSTPVTHAEVKHTMDTYSIGAPARTQAPSCMRLLDPLLPKDHSRAGKIPL